MKIENEQQLTECLQAAEEYLINTALQQVKSGEFDIGKTMISNEDGYKIETTASAKRFKKHDRFDLRIKFSHIKKRQR